MKKTFSLTKEEIEDAVAHWLLARKEIPAGKKIVLTVSTQKLDRQCGSYNTFTATER